MNTIVKIRHSLSIALVAGLLAAGSASAQKAELTPDSGLDISADGNCWDDCSVQITPVGDGAVVAILKNGSVVDQEFTNAPLQAQQDDAPSPPQDGTGPVHEGEDYYGDNNGQMGSWQRSTTWNYENYVLKDVSCEVDFVPMDPPDEGDEDGGSSGGSGG